MFFFDQAFFDRHDSQTWMAWFDESSLGGSYATHPMSYGYGDYWSGNAWEPHGGQGHDWDVEGGEFGASTVGDEHACRTAELLRCICMPSPWRIRCVGCALGGL